MQRKHLLTLVVALAAALSLIFVIPVAADNGRDAGAEAVAPAVETDRGKVVGDTGSDQDIGATTNLVHNDDVEVIGSLGVGLDTVSNQNYGFDTIRLSENNLRIKFNDTSVAAAFPRNDWEIVVNDSSNGGSNYYAIRDHTNNEVPFRIEADARTNALYVEADGDIGIGTNNPAVDVDIKTGNTPTVRLQQDGTSGFTPQTWDMAGNETSFFVRDATSGSTLPFRIRVGAPSSAIDIASNGDVGMGVGGGSVARPLHIRSTGGDPDPEVRLENDAGEFYEFRVTTGGDLVFRPDEGGVNAVLFDSDAVGNQKLFTFDNGTGTEIFTLETDGDLNITGILSSSDRKLKTNIRSIDAHGVLDKVNQLDISTWAFRANVVDRHIGPMAQDWYKIMGLGSTPTHISQTDVNGVLLASIQALSAQNALLAGQNADLQAQIDALGALEARLAELEAQLASLLTLNG